MKLFADKALLNEQWPWTAAHPALAIFTGFTDLAGGTGLLLPGILKWSRQWTVAAATGVLLLMIATVIFHLSRGENGSILFNGFMAVCYCLIIWGRRT